MFKECESPGVILVHASEVTHAPFRLRSAVFHPDVLVLLVFLTLLDLSYDTAASTTLPLSRLEICAKHLQCAISLLWRVVRRARIRVKTEPVTLKKWNRQQLSEKEGCGSHGGMGLDPRSLSIHRCSSPSYKMGEHPPTKHRARVCA